MKVLMLGHSDAGKTSYMASMYTQMNTNRYIGFGIVANDPTDHQSLFRLGTRLRSAGEYPSPTDVRQEYAFSLTLHGRSVLPFTWVDYRGGALYDSGGSQSQLDTLIEDLREADAVLIFLDGPKLLSPAGDDGVDVGRLTSILGAIADHSHPPPVALIVSKADALLARPESPPASSGAQIFYGLAVSCFLACLSIGARPLLVGSIVLFVFLGLGAQGRRSSVIREQKRRRAAAVRAVLDKAVRPLEGIVGAIRESEELQGALIATGCNSRELLNVDKPVLFSLFFGTLARLKRIRALIRELESTARHHESRSSAWNSFSSWWSGDPSHAEQAKQMRAKAAAEEARYAQLMVPARALEPTIKDLFLF